jgi:hypothetical protein
MGLIKRFFGKIFNFKKTEAPKPTVEHFSIPAPKPSAIRKIFRAFRQPKQRKATRKVGIGHSMHRLKHIGGHPVRHLGRAFKESFYHEYGVRLK